MGPAPGRTVALSLTQQTDCCRHPLEVSVMRIQAPNPHSVFSLHVVGNVRPQAVVKDDDEGRGGRQ